MLKKLYELVKQVFHLTITTEQHKVEIKELRTEVRELARAVERVVFELDALRREWEQHQELNESKFENLVLRIENALLRMERGVRGRLEQPKEENQQTEEESCVKSRRLTMRRRTLMLCIAALVLSSFTVGFVSGQKDPGKDKSETLGTNYKITGHIDPVPGQTFPKSWGRLVNYAAVGNNAGTIREQRFVFEAPDGTIRIVKTDLNWNSDLIDDAEVITIGRN